MAGIAEVRVAASERMHGDDWDALLAWKNGDAAAAEQLARRHFSALMRFFINKVRSSDDAAELVSETFLGCLRGRPLIEVRGSFRTYLFGVAMNKLRGYYRTQAKRRRELDDFEHLCVAQVLPRSQTSLVMRAQETKLLVKALRQLSLAQQIVVELAYFDELSGEEISATLGIPRATVYTHLHRGRHRLAQIIGAMTEDPMLAGSTVSGLDTWAAEVRARLPRR